MEYRGYEIIAIARVIAEFEILADGTIGSVIGIDHEDIESNPPVCEYLIKHNDGGETGDLWSMEDVREYIDEEIREREK